MQDALQWVVAITGILALATGGIGWFIRRKDRKRAIMPTAILRDGRIEILNRCDEPLFVERVECERPVCIGRLGRDAYGQEVRPIYEDAPVSPGWEVPPIERAFFPFWIDGPSNTPAKIICSSSLRSLRSVSITAKSILP
ncbi:hypothetical protein GCM10022600_15180 [Qipengyuania pelagi]|uniref:LPXTG cell wall anchor domain-containing protein n=1 Tax=Qipengyuania pelagi TaxID=994320 RepID=A0A844Y8A6_9SPHN|nr:hypothetical protein [Qipengyuania pelagi]MXO53627.1 hypothetical protein [Qipengyuania pelagi]